MNTTGETHWFAVSVGCVVGLAYLFSCPGLFGPILSDNTAVERIFDIDSSCGNLIYWLVTFGLELPQFLLFVCGSTYSAQAVILKLSSNPKFSLSMMFRLVSAIAVWLAILNIEWAIYSRRINSEMYGFIDHASPVWLIEGPFLTNYILNAGMVCGPYWAMDIGWVRIERILRRKGNGFTDSN